MTVTEWLMPTLDNIRAEMARKRRTQVGLAAVLGIAQSGVSARMAGKTPFDVNELYAIAEWLDVPLSKLLVDRTTTDGYPADITVGSFLTAA